MSALEVLIRAGFTAAILLAVSGVLSGVLLARRVESWRYGTGIVPFVFYIPAAVCAGTATAVAVFAGITPLL